MRLGYVNTFVLHALNVDSEEVANVALVSNVEGGRLDVGDGNINAVAVWTGQDAVVCVDNVDGTASIEEAWVNPALHESNFVGLFVT